MPKKSLHIKVSQEYKVEMVSDHYQVRILGINIFVKQRENLKFWMNSSRKKDQSNTDFPLLSRAMHF